MEVVAATSRSQLSEHQNGSSRQRQRLQWPYLFPELLQCISDRLNLRDYLVFCRVCMSWLSAPSSRSDMSSFSKDGPWLMLYGFDGDRRDDTNFYLYDSSNPNCCTMSLPHLRGVTFVESKSGWLLACRNDDLFFYNPFSLKSIDLPKYPKKDVINRHYYAFSSLPTSPDCTTFIVRRIDPSTIEVSLCRLGAQKWDTTVLDTSETPFYHLMNIHCCNCLGNGQCTCTNKYSIFIQDSKVRLRYDFVNRKTSIYEFPGVRHTNDLLRKMADQHRHNWLRKFGEKKGICISFCPLKMKTDSWAGVSSSTCVYTIDGGAETTELNNLKAVWLEPRFQEAFLGKD